jgi:LysR family glycine cleavage system transcriptional activator
MTFKRWIEGEVKVIDLSWKTYLKNNPDMEEVKI